MHLDRKLVLAALAVAAPLLLVACGGDDDDTTADAALPDAPASADAAAFDAAPAGDAAPLAAYEGRWAIREILATVVNAPIVGAVDNRAVTIGFATVTLGAEPRLTLDTCHLELETDNSMLTTAFLPAYQDLIADLIYTPSMPARTLEAAGEIVLQGCTLSDPASEALPTEPDDARVVDEDEDSHPGLTVVATVTGIGEVQIYLVQRARRDLTGGAFVGADKVQGGLTIHEFEQVTLDATNPMFASSMETAPNEEGSSFTMVRVDGAETCATLIAKDEEAVFGSRP